MAIAIGQLGGLAVLGALTTLFFLLVVHGQTYLDIHHLIEMPYDAIQFCCDVTAHGGGDFKVLTADRQIHGASFQGCGTGSRGMGGQAARRAVGRSGSSSTTVTARSRRADSRADRDTSARQGRAPGGS